LSVEKYVEQLKASFSYAKSVDTFLVKLGSVAYEIESSCTSSSCDSREVFKAVIYSGELAEYFKKLACYKSEVLERVISDPRHKILRKYLDIIENRLNTLECASEAGVEPLTPLATWVKEHYESASRASGRGEAGLKPTTLLHTKPLSLLGFTSVEKVLKAMLIASFTLLAVALAVAFLHSSSITP